MRHVSLQFDQAGLTFANYDYYIGNSTEKYHKAYLDYFVGVAKLLGADPNSAMDVGEKLWQFETEIAKVRWAVFW